MRTISDGEGLFAPMWNALIAAMQGTAVTSGCEPSSTGSDLTVSIAAGEVRVGGTAVLVAGGSVSLDAGGAFERYDLVSVDEAGTLAVTKGFEAQKCPPQPTNTCLLAIVHVPEGATVIGTGDVLDARLVGARLSDVAIDEDKDWGGKKITNLGALHTQSLDVAACRTYPSASDHLRATGAASLVLNKNAVRPICTIPSIYGPGTVRVSVSIEIDDTTSAGSYWICVDGVKKSEKTHSGGAGTLSWTADVECEGGQEIGILTDAYNQYTWVGKITSWSVGADDPFSPAW